MLFAKVTHPEKGSEEINIYHSFTYNPYLGGIGTVYTEVR